MFATEADLEGSAGALVHEGFQRGDVAIVRSGAAAFAIEALEVLITARDEMVQAELLLGKYGDGGIRAGIRAAAPSGIHIPTYPHSSKSETAGIEQYSWAREFRVRGPQFLSDAER